MNRYLNNAERNNLLQLGALITAITSMIAGYANTKSPDRNFLKFLRAACTLTDKAMRVRMGYLDRKEIDRMIQHSMKHQIVVRPRDAVIREQKEIAKLDSRTVIDNDDFCDLAEITIITTCQVCTNEGTEIENCRLRELFLQYDIAPLHADADCPYQYEQEPQTGNVGDAMIRALAKGA